MRSKIIIVNVGIVLIVGLLSYALLLTALGDVVSNPAGRKSDVERALRAAEARLALDAARQERWLAEQAASEGVAKVYEKGTADARSQAATAQANKIRDAAVGEKDFAQMAPSMVLFVDDKGVAMGRNGSNLMRGDNMTKAYPTLGSALKSGKTGSDVWMNKQRQEQMFASYAPVRGDEGKVVGALVLGTPLNDERMTRTSKLTSGKALMLGLAGGEVVAKSSAAEASVVQTAAGATVQGAAKEALASGNVAVVNGDDALLFGATPLGSYGDGKQAVLYAVAPTSLVGSLNKLLWPVFGVTALGILLVIAGGVLLGNYISRPISEIEEGLLAIINGQANLRFEIEHPELGGLVTRINSLLNALMGVPETDDEGRPSAPPPAGPPPAI